MRSFTDQILIALPALIAILLLALFAAPLQMGGMSLVPNVAWVMSLIVAALYPVAWPRGIAFSIGLLQDVLFGTPLGSQALLTLLLVELVHSQARRQHYLLFRIRWLEAAGVLIVWQVLLWGVLHFVSPDAASLRSLLRGGLASIVWFPLFYFPLAKLFEFLPAVK
jgi:rod shape-determining protein MreD